MKPYPLLLTLVVVVLLSACVARQDEPLPVRHPADVGTAPPRCSSCHQPTLAPYDHDAVFASDHRSQARISANLCAICHETAYCSDCHALKSELKPADKLETDTYRSVPHRGDYLTLHRIDGRIDPTSCYRCHGNPKNSRTCTPCHG